MYRHKNSLTFYGPHYVAIIVILQYGSNGLNCGLFDKNAGHAAIGRSLYINLEGAANA